MTSKVVSGASGTRGLRLLCSVVLMASLAAAITASMRWPLVGDASLMHYVVFLQKQGLAPYRDIIDINLPGTYALEAMAMRCFGAGAVAWRLYDLALLAAIFTAGLLIAGKERCFAGIFAGALFGLIHLQDGLEQGGQRNLAMAALLLWSYVALFRGAKSQKPNAWILIAGAAMGFTLIIKPTVLPLTLALIVSTAWSEHRQGRSLGTTLGSGFAGLSIPPLLAAAWLLRIHAMPGFLWIVKDVLPLHAEMGRQHLPYLLAHCLSPIALVAGLWLLLSLLSPWSWSKERLLLLVGVVGTAAAYIAEGKGYPYQRYPLLALLLVLIGLDVTRGLSDSGLKRGLAVCTCVIACLVLAPRYAWLTHTFDTATPFQTALKQQLYDLSKTTELQGDVQCLDTFGGCVNTLYDLRLRQSTGFLYDCYLFSGDTAANQRYRERFWAAFQASKPRVVVATNQFCFADPRGFRKLSLWPPFDDLLAQDYTMTSEWKSSVPQHWWNRREMPTQFRLYLRNDRMR